MSAEQSRPREGQPEAPSATGASEPGRRRRRMTWALALPALAIGVSMTAAAAGGLGSTWRAQPITVDGAPDEWPKLEALEKGPSVAVSNDDEFAYVFVAASDPQIASMIAGGVVLWFDQAGGKGQTFGVWIPGAIPPSPTAGIAPPTPPRGLSTRVMDHFDLLGPGKNQRRLVDITPALGIELAGGTRDTEVLYEAKIPLKKSDAHPYAIGVGVGGTVGFGVATPDTPAREKPGHMVGSGGIIGGAGGVFGPGYGGQGFANYREKEDKPKPIAAWTTVKLASK